jgi:hypothetical protein
LTINFLSEEWDAIRKQIEQDIKNAQIALERAQTEREMALAQGTLRALRAMLDLPKQQQKKPQQ